MISGNFLGGQREPGDLGKGTLGWYGLEFLLDHDSYMELVDSLRRLGMCLYIKMVARPTGTKGKGGEEEEESG